MNFDDLDPPLNVGARHRHLPIKAAGAQQRGVEHIGAVGRGNDDDSLIRLKAVHLDEQLVQCLLTLVIRIAQARTAMAADCINFVDKDDARRALLGLLEHVAHPARADAHEHFDKV